MGTYELQFCFKETRLSLEPVSSSRIVQLKVPSAGAAKRTSANRINGLGAAVAGDDEKIYRTKNLATASAIFRRQHHGSPRSFLWRVLETETVLSIRVADICKEDKETESPLIVNLRFPRAFRSSCIGFSDPKEHNALVIFVVDQANQLFEITLRPDAFRKRSVAEGSLDDACKVYAPASFGFKQPHRLAVASSEQVIVTMHDGGIVRLDRSRLRDATHANLWRETIFNVAGWGQSLRGLVPFQRSHTVKYNKINMELTAATSTAIASFGEPDQAFLFSICLDHQLRVWHMPTGNIVYTGDILNLNRDSQDIGKWLLDPTQTNLVKIVDETPAQCLVVTFSPIGAGEFKLWKVLKLADSILVADCYPNIHIVPPSPSHDVWTLADFGATRTEAKETELWVLWKNNITYRTRQLTIPASSRGGSSGIQWKGVVVDSHAEPVETSGPFDPVDASEKWLDFILYPGRFSTCTIETALVMYEKALGINKESFSRGRRNIADSICSVVGHSVVLGKDEHSEPAYEHFRNANETHWMRLWRLILELDKLRGEALSLTVDTETGAIWVTCADVLTAARKCSLLEHKYHNFAALEDRNDNVALLLSAGLDLLGSFTDSMRRSSRAALQPELYDEPSQDDLTRLQNFSEKAGFWRQLTEDDCAAVLSKLGGPNFDLVTEQLYDDLFVAFGNAEGRLPQAPLTELGLQFVIRSVRDTSEIYRRVLFSQILLLAHMESEYEEENNAVHTRVDVGRVFRHMIGGLRRITHVKWLADKQVTLSQSVGERSGSVVGDSFSPMTSTKSTTKRGADEARYVTPLEELLTHLGMANIDRQDIRSSMTEVAADVCDPGSNLELLPYLHQCWLLKFDRPDLALELGSFGNRDPFPTYIQGRVHLALQDYDTASMHFKKASIGLSDASMKPARRQSFGILDDTELNLFDSGLPNYYLHIVNLYDRQKAYSHVIVFARLALQFANTQGRDALTVRTEMQSRLFTASTAISDFDTAHSALLAMENEALQKSCLRKLVERMCETGQNSELVKLPFSGLQNKVDEILFEKCRAIKDIRHNIPYHKILYAWRISRNDFRGGAAVVLDGLEKLRQVSEGDRLEPHGDMTDTQVTRQYLLLINALSCVPSKEAFILEDLPTSVFGRETVEHGSQYLDNADLESSLDDLQLILDEEASTSRPHDPQQGDDALLKRMQHFEKQAAVKKMETPRRFLTLVDLRKHYQQELDRIVAIQNNHFALVDDAVDAMDIA